ncbi:hypothetical protein PAMP_023199 [Pampus punctatissimus]
MLAGSFSVALRMLACSFLSKFVPQDFQDQTLPRQEAETEQADSSVDQNEDWQQDQVQLQEETLEEDQARPVNMRVCGSQHPSILTSPGHPAVGPLLGGSHVIWSSSCFVQILWLCSCLTIKDL